MGGDFAVYVFARDAVRILILLVVVASIFLTIGIMMGCAELPDREMNEYIDMNCVMQIDGRAFCR